MKSRIAVALCVLGVVLGRPAAADDKADPGAAELKKVQGTWTFESQEVGGQKVPADQLKAMTITFEGDKFTVKGGDQVMQAGTQKLDPAKKAVDAKVTEGVSAGTTMLGIYELDGDTLKVCFDSSGKKRPAEYKTTEGNTDTFVAVLKRVKK
jgi:uncharacterized protein (TIGR03067 family)